MTRRKYLRDLRGRFRRLPEVAIITVHHSWKSVGRHGRGDRWKVDQMRFGATLTHGDGCEHPPRDANGFVFVPLTPTPGDAVRAAAADFAGAHPNTPLVATITGPCRI